MPELSTKTGTEGAAVTCPRCKSWLARIDSAEADVEVNCSNRRCRSTIRIVKDNGELKISVIGCRKQA